MSLARRLGLLAIAAAAATASSCAADQPTGAGTGRVTPTYRSDDGRLERLAYDRNGDGREDAWTYMDGTRVLRAELDENFDGTVDRREFYAGGATEQAATGAAGKDLGVLARVELLAPADGRVVRTEIYEKGVLASAEEDTNGDGHPDKWERYERGAMTSLELDTRGRGKPDRRLVYGPEGTSPRVETDPEGTGQFRPVAPVQ